MTKRGGFTLVELLVVMAIIAILAAVLFPVFASVRSKAKATACLSNFRQILAASLMYDTDYDDRVMLAGYGPLGRNAERGGRTWVQIILPYVREFHVFSCPGDFGSKPPPESTFDVDLIPGDTMSRYFQASMRSNAGFNYLYLSPMFRELSEMGVSSLPKGRSEIAYPGSTIMLLDSVFERDDRGKPQGGGTHLVVPPCRYVMQGSWKRDSINVPGQDPNRLYRLSEGWEWDNPYSPRQYGGAWAWHHDKYHVGLMDGSVKGYSLSRLTEGCEVKPQWLGLIQDESLYLWDVN